MKDLAAIEISQKEYDELVNDSMKLEKVYEWYYQQFKNDELSGLEEILL